MNRINIFNESSKTSIPKTKIKKSLDLIFRDKNIDNAVINIIFVNSDAIHKLNIEFLGHDYTTDVISFTLEEEPLEGEIYVCVDVAKQNAKEYKVSWNDEIIRYVIHGALHILGHEDNTEKQREEMHLLENKYLVREN